MIFTIIVIIILICILLYICKRICDIAIKSEIAKGNVSLVFSSEQQEKFNELNNENRIWIEKNSKEVEIISKDGLKLVGYEIKNEEKSNIWVILVHGYMSNSADMVQYAEKMLEYGYNVLLVDLRAHGKSEGTYTGMGWLEHYDMKMWIDKIIEENKNSKIILFGLSMGAATVMMTVGEDLPRNVKLCIEDCGYTSAWEEFALHLKRIFHIWPFPILYISSFMAKIYAKYSFKEASSVKQVEKSKTPILFIHGDKDKFVPFEMLDEVYKAAKCPKEKLIIEGATHAESMTINPEKYWNTIENFAKKYL